MSWCLLQNLHCSNLPPTTPNVKYDLRIFSGWEWKSLWLNVTHFYRKLIQNWISCRGGSSTGEAYFTLIRIPLPLAIYKNGHSFFSREHRSNFRKAGTYFYSQPHFNVTSAVTTFVVDTFSPLLRLTFSCIQNGIFVKR